jgi:hypothetical protein
LFFLAGFFNALHKLDGTTVKDGHFRPVDFDEAVVNFGGPESGHGVFDGAHLHAIFFQDSAPFRVVNIVGQGFNAGFGFQISSDENIARVGRCRTKPCRNVEACVQALAGNGKIVL